MDATTHQPVEGERRRLATPRRAGGDGRGRRESAARRDVAAVEKDASTVKRRVQPALDFWTKVNNDWIFNLSGLLAYNFLMSIFPILLTLLAVAGFILNAISPAALTTFQRSLGQGFPGGSEIVGAVTRQLQRSAGILLIVGVVTAAITGSRLFITIENCFGIIFRVRGRDLVRQNLMAFGMLCLYAVLFPLIFVGPLIPSAILRAAGASHTGGFGAFLIQVAGIAVSAVFAFLFFEALYVVVPNRPVRWGEAWRGSLAAAALLTVYNILFPFYESLFLHPNNYGSVAGFAIVILVFFYYFGFIMLLGAEVNSWVAGHRQTEGDVTALLHAMQAHDTTRGVAGPAAGLPQEDVRRGQGAGAMGDTGSAVHHERHDHVADTQPPKPAEANKPGLPYSGSEQCQERWQQTDEQLKAGAPGPARAPDTPAQGVRRGPEGGAAAHPRDAPAGARAIAARPAVPAGDRRAAGAVLLAAGATIGAAAGWLLRPRRAPARGARGRRVVIRA